MTAVSIVFTCTNATSAGSTHGAGIGTITITGTKESNAALTGITLSGDYDTSFPQNGTFSYEGLVVTASYDDGTSNAVTDYEVSTPDLTTLGTKTVTVSYTHNGVTKTATYDITVEEAFDYAALPFSWEGGSSAALKKENGVTVNCDGSDYAAGNTPYLVKFSKDGHYVLVKTDSQPGKVTVGVKMLGGSTSSYIVVQGSADGEAFTDVETLTISGSQNDILTLETTNAFAATDRYVRLYFKKGSNVGVGPISIALPSSEPAISAEAALSLDYDATSGEIGYSIINPVDGASLTATTEADWITDFVVASDKVTFTITANTGEERSATVMLTYVNATKEVTVTQAAYVDPNAPGTENNPYTVAEAIEATPTTGEVYISGIVSSFYNTSIVGDDSNYRYYISDDGTTDTQLLVYKGKGLNEATFTDADDLKVGDEVVIYGKLTMYNNAPEVASGNYIVSLNRPADTTPSIEVNKTAINVSAESAEGTITVTYNNITEVEAEVHFCDANGGDAEYDWILASLNDDNNIEYIIDPNNGEERTAYMRVYALDDNTEEVYSDIITITQAKYVAPDEEVNPAQAGVGAFVKVTSADEITAGNYLIVYEGNATHDAVAFNGGLETLDAVENGISVTIIDDKIIANNSTVAATFVLQPSGTVKSASGKYIGVTTNSNGLKQSDDASTYTNTFSIDDSGNAVISAVFEGSTMSLRYNYASDNLRFRYYKNAGQQPIALYKYDETATITETVAVSGVGYRTYCSTSDLDFSNTGLTAYKATIANNQVSFTEVTAVPAGQGVLLKGAEGSYNVPVIAEAAELEGNAFVGVTEEDQVDAPIFVLMNGEAGVGFYKTTKTFTVGAHTAYLPAQAAGTNGARSFIGFDFDNTTTAIEGVANVENRNGEVYNLQGQRVSKAQKGLYIVGGKKVLVK